MVSFVKAVRGSIGLHSTFKKLKYVRNNKKEYQHFQLCEVTVSNDAGLILSVNYGEGKPDFFLEGEDKIYLLNTFSLDVQQYIFKKFRGKVFKDIEDFKKAVWSLAATKIE